MESILTWLSVISTGSVPSGRAHWIEGAGRPVTLHWRVWMESKIATGCVGGTAIEGGTVLVRVVIGRRKRRERGGGGGRGGKEEGGGGREERERGGGGNKRIYISFYLQIRDIVQFLQIYVIHVQFLASFQALSPVRRERAWERGYAIPVIRTCANLEIVEYCGKAHMCKLWNSCNIHCTHSCSY